MSIQAEFDRLAPWQTKFTINGASTDGQYEIPGQAFTQQFFDCFPHARRILELGSLEGARTIDLAAHPQITEVIAIEAREANLIKARYIQSLYGQDKIHFVQADLETADLSQHGQFDAVFCSGILYHMPEPWNLLRRCLTVSPNLYLATHYATSNQERRNGYAGMIFKEDGPTSPLSGLSPDSFWPTLGSLYEMLFDCGYKTVTLINKNPQAPRAPGVVLTASR